MEGTNSGYAEHGHVVQGHPPLPNPELVVRLTPPGLPRLPADSDQELQAALERLMEFRAQRPLQSNQELWATVRDLVHQWYTG